MQISEAQTATGKVGNNVVFSRKSFLRLGATGIAGAALLGVAIITLGRRTYTPAPELSISPDNAAVQNRDAFLALSNTDEYVSLPAGDYLFDNTPSTGTYAPTITGFGGRLLFEEGARIVFTDNVQAGLWFEGGTGIVVEGWRSTFQTLPSARIGSKYCLNFKEVTEPLVRDCEIVGSASIGLTLDQCIRPRVEGAQISNTLADGLHVANCQDARIERVTTRDTGDDGIAIINFTRRSDLSGAHVTNVTVIRSGTRGIVVGGQRDVTIEDFEVDASYSAGVLVFYEAPRDPATGQYLWIMRTPSNVRLARGEIRDAGKGPRGTGAGFPQGDGIFFFNVGNSIEFNDIEVYAPSMRGITGNAGEFSRVLSDDGATVPETGGHVRLSEIQVNDTPEEGFILEGGTYDIDNLTARRTGGHGVYIRNSEEVTYGVLETLNVSKNDLSCLAFNFENNARVNGGTLYVRDDQTNPTGIIVSARGEQAGNLGTVDDDIENGEVSIENPSGLKFARAWKEDQSL